MVCSSTREVSTKGIPQTVSPLNSGLLRARPERPRGERAAKHRDELAPFHCPMPPVLPTERITHLGRVDCCIHPPGRNKMTAITPPIILPKEVAQNRPPHFPPGPPHRQKSFRPN